jgi:hypothetical protein
VQRKLAQIGAAVIASSAAAETRRSEAGQPAVGGGGVLPISTQGHSVSVFRSTRANGRDLQFNRRIQNLPAELAHRTWKVKQWSRTSPMRSTAPTTATESESRESSESQPYTPPAARY